MKNDVRNMFMTYYPHTLFPRRVLNRERVCNRPPNTFRACRKRKQEKRQRRVIISGSYNHNRKPVN
ncbi:hypothetical protein TcasGA2_TC009242 [Tribolium castaneum]|uniref:Uncharacterized protein n=1 Tax=Tribolium castaneum TaxID=7070 RepID=D6WSH6_TRICA|nr:hypothetical protein TcasGA2_TC009242 [Tribolium castaneum]